MPDARAVYNVFGTSAAQKTLTASFVADSQVNSIFLFDGYRELVLNISLTTGAGTGEFCQVQIETCNDLGNNPTNWFVFSENNYPNSTPATYLAIAGTPYQTPGDVTTPAAATNYVRSYALKLQARWIRIKVKSTAGSSFGSAWVQAWISER